MTAYYFEYIPIYVYKKIFAVFNLLHKVSSLVIKIYSMQMIALGHCYMLYNI